MKTILQSVISETQHLFRPKEAWRKETAKLWRVELISHNISDMSDRYLEILRVSDNPGNYIPSGRQLPRTPPLTDVKRHLNFYNEDPNNDYLAPEQNREVHAEIVLYYTTLLYQTGSYYHDSS